MTLEILKILVELISATIWPITVLIIVYFFRKEIVKAVGRIKWFKYNNLEAHFEEQLKEVESESKQLKDKTSSTRKSLQEVKNEDKLKFFDRLHNLSEASPRGAILEAWVELVSSIKSFIKKKNPDADLDKLPPHRLINMLKEDDEIDPHMIDTLHKMRNLRNSAVHLPDFVLTSEEAERYIDVIDGLDFYFRNDGL